MKERKIIISYSEYDFSHYANEEDYKDYLISNDLEDNEQVQEMYWNDRYEMFFDDCGTQFENINELENKKALLITTDYYVDSIIDNREEYENEEDYMEAIIDEANIEEFRDFADIVKHESKITRNQFTLSIQEEAKGQYGIYKCVYNDSFAHKSPEYVFVNEDITDEELIKIIINRYK